MELDYGLAATQTGTVTSFPAITYSDSLGTSPTTSPVERINTMGGAIATITLRGNTTAQTIVGKPYYGQS